MFAVTFSVVFAYVADCTEEGDRSTAYGLVSRALSLMYFTLHYTSQFLRMKSCTVTVNSDGSLELVRIVVNA